MSRAASPAIVGRAQELASLRVALDEASAGALRTVLVDADAGGGKTRLIREFVAGLDPGTPILEGNCVEQSEVLPYAPITAGLRKFVRAHGVEHVADLLNASSANELAALLPEFGPIAEGGDPSMARGRLFEVLLRLIEAIAERSPLVLVVEDLHWADHTTIDVLTFLLTNLRLSPVLVLITLRGEEVGPTHPASTFVGELERRDGTARLMLPHLTRREVAIQIEGILGRKADPAVASDIFRVGGGVPLFTEALLTPGGAVRPGLPDSLRDLLLRATRELPAATQTALRAAAIGGSIVQHAVVAHVLGIDDSVLNERLRPAVEASVLDNLVESYGFRHDLIRQAIKEDVLPGERSRFHRGFAEALEDDRSRTARSPETCAHCHAPAIRA